MSKSATASQQQMQPQFDELDVPASKTSDAGPTWKQEVNQRLAAHRNRKSEAPGTNARASDAARPASGRAAEAAARVAARYAKAPSYQQVLAGEARAAVRAAGAAAEAARSAHAAAQAVLAGLESELDHRNGAWEEQAKPSAPAPRIAAPAASRWQDEPPAEAANVSQESTRLAPRENAQSRWEDAVPAAEPDIWSEMRVHPTPEFEMRRDEPRQYRRGNASQESDLFQEERFDEFHTEDPLAHATVEPVQHLPANLIEFPRELVATRKARPRRAEGPLYDPAHEDPQLRIFEVEPPEPSPMYEDADVVAPPEWASIELDHPVGPEAAYHEHAAHPGYSYARTPELGVSVDEAMGGAALATGGLAIQELPVEMARAARQEKAAAQESPRIRNAVVTPQAELLVAQVSDRLLALLVDGALVTLAFLVAAMVVISATPHPPSGKTALIASVCGWFVFAQVYQLLFLSYAEEGTPGMRYARIALCTFDDDNPTPAQMRKRIPALLVSMLPLGLGMIWALWDKDHLGWHDRMTKMYQRKY